MSLAAATAPPFAEPASALATDPARALELLAAVTRAPAELGVDDVEAVLQASAREYTRVASNQIIQDGRVVDARVAVRAVAAGRTASAFTNDLSPEGLRAVRERAALMARHARGPADFPGLPTAAEAGEPPPPPATAPRAHVPETAAWTAAEKAETLARAFASARAHALELAGSYHTGTRAFAVASSRGVARHFRGTVAELKLFALADVRTSGFAGGVATDHRALDVPRLAEVALEKCARARDPVDLPPGDYDVIIEPEAVVELLEWMAQIGFTARALEERTSFLAGRLGEPITGEAVTLYDDPACSAGVGLPMPFDWEGVRRSRVDLITRGRAAGFVTDTHSARRLGCVNTGHATGGDLEPSATAAPGNVVLAPGRDSTADLLGRVERGLWVTRFHYVNGLIDPRRATMTGLTRDGTFLIENGRLTRGVRTLRFTDAILDALARMDGATQELRAVPTGWSELGAYAAPTVLVRRLRFTGAQGGGV